jgi:hypothetical protein
VILATAVFASEGDIPPLPVTCARKPARMSSYVSVKPPSVPCARAYASTEYVAAGKQSYRPLSPPIAGENRCACGGALSRMASAAYAGAAGRTGSASAMTAARASPRRRDPVVVTV